MYSYAQLNNDGCVVCLLELSGIVNLPEMILLSDEDKKKVKLLSRYVDGEWIDPEPLE